MVLACLLGVNYYFIQCPRKRKRKHSMLKSDYNDSQKLHFSLGDSCWLLLGLKYKGGKKASGGRATAGGTLHQHVSYWLSLCYRKQPEWWARQGSWNENAGMKCRLITVTTWPMYTIPFSFVCLWGQGIVSRYFFYPENWTVKLLVRQVPLMISIVNSQTKQVPKGVGVAPEKENMWEHCWEGKVWAGTALALREPWVWSAESRYRNLGCVHLVEWTIEILYLFQPLSRV